MNHRSLSRFHQSTQQTLWLFSMKPSPRLRQARQPHMNGFNWLFKVFQGSRSIFSARHLRSEARSGWGGSSSRGRYWIKGGRWIGCCPRYLAKWKRTEKWLLFSKAILRSPAASSEIVIMSPCDGMHLLCRVMTAISNTLATGLRPHVENVRAVCNLRSLLSLSHHMIS